MRNIRKTDDRPIIDTNRLMPLRRLLAIPEKELFDFLGINTHSFIERRELGPDKYDPDMTLYGIWRYNVCLCKYKVDAKGNCHITQLNRVRLSIVPRYDVPNPGTKMLAISTMETLHHIKWLNCTGIHRAECIKEFNVGVLKFRAHINESLVAATVYNKFKSCAPFNPLIWRVAKSFANNYSITGCNALKKCLAMNINH